MRRLGTPITFVQAAGQRYRRNPDQTIVHTKKPKAMFSQFILAPKNFAGYSFEFSLLIELDVCEEGTFGRDDGEYAISFWVHEDAGFRGIFRDFHDSGKSGLFAD